MGKRTTTKVQIPLIQLLYKRIYINQLKPQWQVQSGRTAKKECWYYYFCDRILYFLKIHTDYINVLFFKNQQKRRETIL